MPGQRASSASIISATVGDRELDAPLAPGNRLDQDGRQPDHDRQGARMDVRHRSLKRSTTSVSTEEIVGRCWATQVQLSPSSALAYSAPELVPK